MESSFSEKDSKKQISNTTVSNRAGQRALFGPSPSSTLIHLTAAVLVGIRGCLLLVQVALCVKRKKERVGQAVAIASCFAGAATLFRSSRLTWTGSSDHRPITMPCTEGVDKIHVSEGLKSPLIMPREVEVSFAKILKNKEMHSSLSFLQSRPRIFAASDLQRVWNL